MARVSADKAVFHSEQNHELARTLSIVKELAMGKTLHLPDGYRIGMGQDMSIGYLHTLRGEDYVSGLATMDLAQLNHLLNEHEIGNAIPDVS